MRSRWGACALLRLFQSTHQLFEKSRGGGRSGFFILWAIFMSLLGAADSRLFGQDLDETRERRAPIRAMLLWDNVTATESFLFGKQPEFSPRHRMEVVTLWPGESTDVLVPPHELVRVVDCDNNGVGNGEIEIWVSNGTGVYRRQNSALSDDEKSLLAVPDQDGYSVAKIWRPASAEGSRCIAIYTSHRSVPKLLDYYQCDVMSRNADAAIATDTGQRTRNYHCLSRDAQLQFSVPQPTRVRVEARLKYGADAEQRQSFWIQVWKGGKLKRVLSFDTLPQRNHRVTVNDQEMMVGRREFAYMDLDGEPGNVELRASHNLYVRVEGVGLDVCRPRLNSSFNGPAWENLKRGTSIWDEAEFDPGSLALSRSFLVDDENEEELPDPIWDPYLNYQRIQALARDNRVPFAGLRAYMWMRAMATRHYHDAEYGDEISIPEMARRLRSHYTYFSDLYPAEIDGRRPRKVAYVHRSIRGPRESVTETVVGEQHVHDALSGRPAATLFWTDDDDQPLSFMVPENLGVSLLRLIVDQSHLTEATRVMVQYDERPPIEMSILKRDALPANRFVPSFAEAAMTSLQQVATRYGAGFVGGPFAVRNEVLPIVEAGTHEMLLPSGVKRVRVWIDSSDRETDRVVSAYLGLQFLNTRRTHLTESAFLNFRNEKKRPDIAPEWLRFVSRELENDSTPAQRLLTSHWMGLSTSIQPSPELASPQEVWSDQRVAEQIELAQNLASQEQWVPAVETLSKIIQHATGDVRREAILARANALESAGEFYLAERERRGWLKFSDDRDLKLRMFEQLLERCDFEDDHDFPELYSAFVGIEMEVAGLDGMLSRELVSQGRYRFALQALESLNVTDKTADLMLRSCVQLEWWQLFDSVHQTLDDPEKRAYWSAVKTIRLGQYENAYELLKTAGIRGQQLLRHWEQGHRIYTRLRSPKVRVRLEAIAEWENWQASYPGPTRWQTEMNHFVGGAEVRSAYHGLRDIRWPLFIARPDKPAALEIHGPVTIKLEARPLHTADSQTPLDDWIRIRHAKVEYLPVNSNIASRSLQLDDDLGRLVGSRVEAELELPAGNHRIEVAAQHSDLGLRVSVKRPELRSPVLPFVNATTMASVLSGDFGNVCKQCSSSQSEDYVRLVRFNCVCESIPFRFLNTECQCGNTKSLADAISEIEPDLIEGLRDRFEPGAATGSRLVADPETAELWEQVRQFEISDGSETKRMDLVVQTRKLRKQSPTERDLHRISTRLERGSRWELFPQYDSRAGIHMVELRAWQPESPSLRTRRGLMGAVDPDFVLVGNSELSIRLETKTVSSFEFQITRPSIGFLPRGPVKGQLKIGQTVRTFEIPADKESIVIQQEISPDTPTLTLNSDNPMSNHYLLVNVREVLADGTTRSVDRSAFGGERKKLFQVATKSEPLRFRIRGPAVLRIDKLDSRGGVLIQTVEVGNELMPFELQPGANEEIAKFRIYELKLDGESLPSHSLPKMVMPANEHWSDSVVEQVFASALEYAPRTDSLDLLSIRSPDEPPVVLTLNDAGSLGFQEQGTWVFEAGFRQRRAIDEDLTGRRPGNFFETSVERYHFDEEQDRYIHNKLLVRPRLGSGPTFGWLHHGDLKLYHHRGDSFSAANGWGPQQVRWSAYLFTQHAGTPLVAGEATSPWSFGGSFRVRRRQQLAEHWSQTPELRIFGRVLSEEADFFPAGELDQDIFTQYKSDHWWGMGLSNRFVYQSALDQRVWVMPNLMTNPDELVPDHLGVTVGTDQLVGPLQVRLSYRLRGFLSDNDRRQASLQNVVNLRLLFERWHNRKRRTELTFGMQHDLDSGGTNLGLHWTSVFNHARGYRDISGDSLLFGSIRRERAAKQYFYRQR